MLSSFCSQALGGVLEVSSAGPGIGVMTLVGSLPFPGDSVISLRRATEGFSLDMK